eukprot:GDKJ01039914.1.p1 GENE.GDKJ01039914.1~~GDKJ01039914.1.p1  ORF type:complete len:200 (+),score=47.58 GDKJ01039914.1:1-600(+)
MGTTMMSVGAKPMAVLGRRTFVSLTHPRCATFIPGMYAHPPPAKEFNADGTPKKYRLQQFIYNHNFTWERWTLEPAGVFHTVYKGVFAQDMPWYWAVYGNYPPIISLPISSVLLFTAACVIAFGGTIGIKPKRFTVEWLEAQKERDRIENSNAVTNYLDRRRKERGSHWLMKEYMPEHSYFLWMGSNHHDTELLRNRED